MSALITDKFRVYNAKQFLESFDEAVGTEHFFFVGRSKDWASVVEFYGLSGTGPNLDGTTQITIDQGGTPVTATIVGGLEGAWIVTGLDPALLTTLAFGQTIDWTVPGVGSAQVLKVRPATEDTPLRPLDNLIEKYDYYREIIAAKRIFNQTIGDGSATLAPDGSYVSAVINRLDYGINSDFTDRTDPYDMWRPNYAADPTFTRLSQGATGEAGVANLEMITRNSQYEVFMCIDNKPDATGLGTVPDLPVTNGPRFAGVAPVANPDTAGYHAASGIFRTNSGQRWKYLYTLSTTDVLRFQSQRFIPLRPFAGVSIVGPEVVTILDGGSGWADGVYYTPINGDGQVDNSNFKICRFEVTGGTGVISDARVLLGTDTTQDETNGVAASTAYTYATVNLADQGVTGTENRFKTGVFTSADLTAAATVPPATPGALEVVIPPQGGYGSTDGPTFQEQLNAKRVMCNIRLTFGEGGGDFPVTNDFRRIGLLRDPKEYNGSGGTEITGATPETVRNTFAVSFGAGTSYIANFVPDEEIEQTQGTAGGAAPVAKGTVVEWLPNDPNNVSLGGKLRYYQDPILHRDENGTVNPFVPSGGDGGDVTTGGDIIGSVSGSHPTTDVLTTATNAYGSGNLPAAHDVDGATVTADILYPELEPYTGEIIYVENRRLITRAEDQIEDIKLVIEF